MRSRHPPHVCACACFMAAVAVGQRGVDASVDKSASGTGRVNRVMQVVRSSSLNTNSSNLLLSRPRQPVRVLNATRTRQHQPVILATSVNTRENSSVQTGQAVQVTRTGRNARLTTEVEIDQIIIAALALLALYCFVALRRGGRRNAQSASGDISDTSAMIAIESMNGTVSGTRKARGATRAQIETHLAHTTVTLYDGVCTDYERSASNSLMGNTPLGTDPQFDQQCAICLELLRKPVIAGERNTVRILRCTHAFHDKCIDAWLLRNTQCPLCLKQPW